VVRSARIAIEAGAHGITVHPRPDERHIRRADVTDIAELLRRYPRIELNIEGNPFLGLLDHAQRVRPTQCTMVPDAEGASTSDHGWSLAADGARLRPILAGLRAAGVRTSLFLDPDPDEVARAHDLGCDRIELYTGPYAVAFEQGTQAAVLPAYVAAAEKARALGLGLNAGHDLNLGNLPLLVAKIPYLAEVSIGHALIADALEFGLTATVRKYLAALGHPASAA
jgi:pyridoxine 5-phosphate synthase